MKKVLFIGILAISGISLSSCGVNYSWIMNHNINNTQVNLSSDNFKVMDRVVGSATVPYVLIFGDMNRTQLYAQAYGDMINKANLKGGSRAVINTIYEEHMGGVFPFYYKRTVTISSTVIEFSK